MASQMDVADICARSVASHDIMVLRALYPEAVVVLAGLATGRQAILFIT